MANVTEREILSLFKDTFRLTAEHCDKLAVLPSRGPVYLKLKADLLTCENCCRQVAYYRQDARWFQIGLMMEEAHKRCGNWLRDRSMPRTSTSNLAHPLFLKLGENLRFAAAQIERLETMATGRVGMILPTPAPGPTRTEGRLVQVRRTPGGIIIPDGIAA